MCVCVHVCVCVFVILFVSNSVCKSDHLVRWYAWQCAFRILSIWERTRERTREGEKEKEKGRERKKKINRETKRERERERESEIARQCLYERERETLTRAHTYRVRDWEREKDLSHWHTHLFYKCLPCPIIGIPFGHSHDHSSNVYILPHHVTTTKHVFTHEHKRTRLSNTSESLSIRVQTCSIFFCISTCHDLSQCDHFEYMYMYMIIYVCVMYVCIYIHIHIHTRQSGRILLRQQQDVRHTYAKSNWVHATIRLTVLIFMCVVKSGYTVAKLCSACDPRLLYGDPNDTSICVIVWILTCPSVIDRVGTR